MFHVYDYRVAILFEIAMFSSFHRNEMQQQRPVAPGISGVPHGAPGSFDTGLLHRQCINTCMLAHFSHSHTQVENEHINKHTHTCKHKHPATSPTCHMLSVLSFHVLRPNFWLVPTSRQGVLVYFLEQVNILHTAPSCWKSGQCMSDDVLSGKMEVGYEEHYVDL